MVENPYSSARPLTNDAENSKFFYEFNIDTTDDACTVPETETYSFSLTGDDATKFTLSSATGNDSDTHYIYLDTILIMKIHQIPIQIMFTMSILMLPWATSQKQRIYH